MMYWCRRVLYIVTVMQVLRYSSTPFSRCQVLSAPYHIVAHHVCDYSNVLYADLAVGDVGDGAVLLEVDVEPVRLEILSDHHARLDDAGLLGKVSLAKGLATR